MSDARPWIKVTDTFPEHPKTLALSDASFRALVSFWCYANRNTTDGFLPKNFAKTQARPASIRQLISVGFLTETDQNGGGYLCHDYLDHQSSREEIEERRGTKKKAGAVGGTLAMHRRWHEARGRSSADCTYCQATRTA